MGTSPGIGRSGGLLTRLIAGGLAVVAAAALGTALWSPSPQEETRAGSPEAAAQSYLKAVVRRDAAGAAAHLSTSSPCDVEDLEALPPEPDTYVELVGVRPAEDVATVAIAVTAGSASMPPFTWTEDVALSLRLEGGRWRLTGSPWPTWDCAGTSP
jgi:hypothetical protein